MGAPGPDDLIPKILRIQGFKIVVIFFDIPPAPPKLIYSIKSVEIAGGKRYRYISTTAFLQDLSDIRE